MCSPPNCAIAASTVSFPELVRASEALPLDTLIDGEIVIADADGSSDFGALQQRLGVSGDEPQPMPDAFCPQLRTVAFPCTLWR
jgi:hypothetical protein